MNAAQALRLVFHLGPGKTGTTAIQSALRARRDALLGQGCWYLGMMLEHAPVQRYHWQKITGTPEFVALDKQLANAQLLEVFRASLPAIREAGCHTIVWSNEWFLQRTGFVIDTVSALAESGLEVQIVSYVRRHDAWARSAYIQWGIKDKRYPGKTRPFAQWLKYEAMAFAAQLAPWIERFPERCAVRNFDAIADVVADFQQLTGLDGAGLESVRVNEAPSAEELLLRVLENDRAAGRGAAPAALTTVLEKLLPGAEELAAVRAHMATDRAALNRILADCGQPPLDDAPLSATPPAIDVERVLELSLHTAQQARRLAELEQHAGPSPAQPGARAPDAAALRPVFVISTGRSGSTLVQRLLNCHPALVVWGEHHGFLASLLGAYTQMSKPGHRQATMFAPGQQAWRQLVPTLVDPGAALEWVNPCSAEEFATQLRQFISGYFAGRLAPGQRWGFKEILYNAPAVLVALARLFPQGRFIFVKRDRLEVTRSKVHAFVKESNWERFPPAEQTRRIRRMLGEIDTQYRAYDEFLEKRPAAGLIVEYERLVSAPREVTASMLAHLGLDEGSYDWSLAQQVMQRNVAATPPDAMLTLLVREIATLMATEQA
ncbi:MAG: sulfotransferase [Gammaproteobacteria bacterium]|nr:sulfotransferase [Gammaproteobacteria bacterium]